MGFIADEGASDDPVANVSRAPIIDLVPDNDPVISTLVRLVGDRFPMRDSDLLDPLNPHRIIDVTQLVDVFGPGGQREFEGRFVHSTSVSMNP